jgi:hypothetical protein
LVLQPAGRRTARHTTTSALKRFFAIADALELSAVQQERAALVANIHYSLTAEAKSKDRAWAWVHAPQEAAPFDGDSPLYFMLENGLPALREVARLLVRESEPR